ncbi:MAG: oligosaccharide flippase family protein [Sulfurovum sp.]|nr:oligosaccharide flippase family protein [Sulfurovum sp.]
MNSLKSQGINAFIWDFSGKIVMHGMTFVVAIILARLLEPSDFGLIAMVMVLFAMAGIFSDIGLSEALVQRKRVLAIHYSSVFYFNIFMASLLSIVSFSFAYLIADFYNNQDLIVLIQVISISFILQSLNSVHIAQFRKNLNFKALTKITFIASLLGGALGVSLAFQGLGVWSLVVQQLSTALIMNLLIWKTSTWRPHLVFSFKALTQLWNFGFRIFLSALLDKVFSRLDIIIIAKLFPPAMLGFSKS